MTVIRTMRTKLLATVLLSAMALSLTACKEKDLKQIANWGNTVTSSMEEFGDLVIRFSIDSRISEHTTGTLLIKVLKINNNMQVAKNTITRIRNRKKAGGDAMTESERMALSGLFLVIRDTALELDDIDVFGIEDEGARASLRTILSVVLTVLANITDLLGGA